MDGKIDDGGPAFPCDDFYRHGYVGHAGMSLRDWFAGQVLAGLLADSSVTNISEAVDSAYTTANAMLARRQRA